MKLKEAMRKAIRTNDAATMGRIAEYCRFALGWDYDTILTLTSHAAQCPPQDVETLLYEADSMEER